jgi:NADPH:quinone reductase-like Zn-dependent oxidoreductase
MKALKFRQYGPPASLMPEELECPQPAPGEVLVQVYAAGINPSDVKNLAGLFNTPLPRVPGRDYAGVVVSEGPWQGREVWGSGAGFGTQRDGSHAGFVCVPEAGLSHKPAVLGMAEAASAGVPWVTAWQALVGAAEIRAGETLVVIGSQGAVGRAAVQIAHWRGARVIGVGQSAEASEAGTYLRTGDGDLGEQVRQHTGGRGADLVLDTVGGAMFEAALSSLRHGGRHIAIASTGSRRVSFDLIDFYHREARLIGVDTMKLDSARIAAILDELAQGFARGVLRPAAIDTWTLDQAAEAYSAVEQHRSRKRNVFLMAD